MKMKNPSHLVKITFFSAATIITFAGAALVMPPVKAQNQFKYGQTIEVDTSELKSLGLTDDTESKFNEAFVNRLFDKFNSEGIREKMANYNEWKFNSDVLEYLGVTRKELLEYRENGKSLKDIAEEKGLSTEELANILEDHFRERIEAKYQKGLISRERYLNIMDRLENLREKALN